jgi:hypothetical protein
MRGSPLYVTCSIHEMTCMNPAHAMNTPTNAQRRGCTHLQHAAPRHCFKSCTTAIVHDATGGHHATPEYHAGSNSLKLAGDTRESTRRLLPQGTREAKAKMHTLQRKRHCNSQFFSFKSWMKSFMGGVGGAPNVNGSGVCSAAFSKHVAQAAADPWCPGRSKAARNALYLVAATVQGVSLDALS